ncbi:MAG: hypothetical protein AAB587_02005 [Patescibacteria group bacterium]
MKILKGRIVYSGVWLSRPWDLTQDSGATIDIYPFIDEVLWKLKGKLVSQRSNGESYTLHADSKSKYRLLYEPDKLARLKLEGGIGGSNVCAYLPEILTWLSGRKVRIEIHDTGFKIMADESEKVFGVKFFGRGNMARVPQGAEVAVCKIGQSNCCIFLMSQADGFTCAKFSSLAQGLLHRHSNGTIRASYVGSCAIVGREKEVQLSSPARIVETPQT